jgi:prepilin-type N-terminal cleavage/methylation domain-containing protein
MEAGHRMERDMDPDPGTIDRGTIVRARTPAPPARRRAAFTVVELLTVIAVLSLLAALAIPAHSRYQRRARTSEATRNLGILFRGAAAYYEKDHREDPGSGTPKTACRVDRSTWMPSADPSGGVQEWSLSDNRKYDNWRALGMGGINLYYFSYRIWTRRPASECRLEPGNAAVYTFRARGDLDGDNVNSMFELAVGSDRQNELRHARGILITNEFE